LAVVGAAYYLAAELGLRLALVGRTVTPLWPPTGVALVAFLAWGRSMWPAVTVAAFAANAPIGPTAVAAGGIAVGNTLAPLAAATLLSKVDFRRTLDRVRDAVALVLLGALVSMAVSATLGTATLFAAGAIGTGRLLDTWSVWWTGDAMGVLIVAPFLWSLAGLHWRIPAPRVAAQAIGVGALLLATCAVVFSTAPPLAFLVVPVLGAIAWRYQQRGAAPAALLVSVIATWAAAHDVGPFENQTLLEKMIALQSLNATVALTAIFAAAAVVQQRRAAARERETVELLQRSLLPEVPHDRAGTAIAARYVPAGARSDIGGDWYDLVPLRLGRLGLVVGDVAGHGVGAAAAMGQLRTALRLYARESLMPAEALGRLGRLQAELAPATIATVWYGQFDPESGRLTFASAGHPPPLLFGPDGRARFVEELHAPPLGVRMDAPYPECSCILEPGTTLLLYTDGLVEVRHEPIDGRLEQLRALVENGPADLEELCDHVMARMLDGVPRDDVAVLAIRSSAVGSRLRLTRPAAPSALAEIRTLVRGWLHDHQVAAVDADAVLIAAGEALTNSVRHAYQNAAGSVELELWLGEDEVDVSVRDRGRWRASPSGTRNGRGLELIRAVMHTVEVAAEADGTEVRMARRTVPAVLAAAPAADGTPLAPRLDAEPPRR
jgi:serine phosphatase RsbU (regulator of sigma subunit)/anti-sigma regulatory factor (Ser/Thr protein kinase)